MTRSENSSQCNRDTGGPGAKSSKTRNVSKSVHRLEESVTTKPSFPHLSASKNQEHALGHFALEDESGTSSHDQKNRHDNSNLPGSTPSSFQIPSQQPQTPKIPINPSTISQKPNQYHYSTSTKCIPNPSSPSNSSLLHPSHGSPPLSPSQVLPTPFCQPPITSRILSFGASLLSKAKTPSPVKLPVFWRHLRKSKIAAARPLPEMMIARIPRVRFSVLEMVKWMAGSISEWGWIVCSSRGAEFWRVGCGNGDIVLGFWIRGEWVLCGRTE